MTKLTICLIICVLTMISYIVGKLPTGLTAMVSMVLFVLTGCLDPNTAVGYFGNTNGVMMLSMFVVAAGFNRTQFVRKCASSVNKIAKGSLTRVMFGYVVITALLAQFIQSSVIVYRIMAPMLIASCDELGIKPSKVLFPLAMMCIAPISTLPLGSGATQFAELNGYLEANEYTKYVVGLTDPMKARLPMMIFLAIYCIFLAPRFAPDEPVVDTSAVQSRKDTREALPPFQERAGYIIFILTTLALIFQPQLKIATWVICLSGALAMVLFGVLTEKEAIGAINWPMAFLFVGALSMGGALTETGAGEVVGNILASFANTLSNPYLIGLVFFVVPFFLTQIMMNRTVMIIFIPIAILACKAMGANPVGIIILVQSACLSSFMTPMATPAVPMCMASGGYDIKSLVKQSLIPAVVLCIVAVGWIMTVFPLY
ncbi:MAG: anion permease [Solobacterium sp.]|nr:anion permease [Solobacterium sp.]